jgi:hypothetical protein
VACDGRRVPPSVLNRPLEALDDDKPVEALASGDYRRGAG